MKIVIVGAGISGLTTDLFLRKLSSHLHIPLDLIIYEKHRAAPNVGNGVGAPTVGGALGLAPNGLHVLRDLDEELFLQVVALGYSISHFSMRTSPGRTLASFPAADSGKPPLHTLLISRQLFWETLRSKVPDDVVVHANIAKVQCHGSQRPRVVFADGAPDVEADLVIGADGVRSIVQRAVTGDGKEDQQPAIFEGLVGVGGFMPASRLSPNHPPGQMTLTFGAHGFFGYGPCALSTPVNQADGVYDLPASKCVWWSTYQMQNYRRKKPLTSSTSSDNSSNAAVIGRTQSFESW